MHLIVLPGITNPELPDHDTVPHWFIWEDLVPTQRDLPFQVTHDPRRVARYLAVLGSFAALAGSAAIADAQPAALDLEPFIDAIARRGCAGDPHCRTVGGVPCDKLAGADGDPEAALQALGTRTREVVQALSLATKSEDAACAKNAGGVLATAHTGARTIDELAGALVASAVKDATSLAGPAAIPAGLVLSIPGLTQSQYDYKGLSPRPGSTAMA